MKSKVFFTTCLIAVTFSINAQSFKTLYNEAFGFLEINDYESALPILLEMHELQPNNANTNFSIGNCYMNSSYDKPKAIPYYEKAQESMTIEYVVGSHREKKAPLDVIQLLGEAYHYNYEFEKAVERFEFYKQFLDQRNLDDIRTVNRLTRISKFALEQMNNPKDYIITALGDVNTEYPEYRPKLNAEENVMFFTSRRSGGYNVEKDADGKYFEDIYMTVKHHDVWGDPFLIQDRINSQGHDACLYVSPDAQVMYVYRHDTDDDKGGIYKVQKEGDNWGELTLLESAINSEFWETDVSLDTYGNIIFFTSDRDGGYGGRDIWMMKKLPNGEWAEAQNLGENINTVYDEEGAYLHPDGKTLYFSSQGHQTMGGHDFFKSTFNDDGTFSEPENLGYPLNTVGNDLYFFPSVSGQKAYFSSFRDGGKGDQDLYVMNLSGVDESDLAVYKGVVKDTVGNVVKDLVISIFDEENDGSRYGIYRPNEITGRFLFILQAGHDYEILYQLGKLTTKDIVNVPQETDGVIDYTKVVTVESDTITLTAGKVVDGDIIAIALLDDVENIAVTSLDLSDTTNTKDNSDVVNNTDNVDVSDNTNNSDNTESTDITAESLPTLYFVYERTRLIDNSKSDLQKVYQFLKKNPSVKIKITGHTDSNGEEDYNNRFSKLRANSIKSQLNKKGISNSRMIAAGVGESQPKVSNTNSDGSDNPEGRQQNRRVEFEIVK